MAEEPLGKKITSDIPTPETEPFISEPTQPRKEDYSNPENYEFALAEYKKKLATYTARVQWQKELKRQVEAKGIDYPDYNYFCPIINDKTFERAPFKPAKVSIWLAEHDHFKTDLKTGILYFYNGKSWVADAEPYLEQITAKILGEENRQSHFNNILHDLKGLTYTNIEFSNKIATPNGLLNVETQELTPNTPEEMTFFSIPTEYIPNTPYPQFQAWLDEVLPKKEDQMLLQEWSGYILLPDYRFHKLLFNYGEGRNGKGTWERTIEAVIGKQNVSEVALEEFNGFHRFAMFQLYGKLLNLCSEPTVHKDYTLQTALLKKATGQDTISAERKGTDKRIDYTNTAKITVSANSFPKITDTSTAFRERRLFLVWEKEYLDSNGTQIQDIHKNWIQGEHDERKGILCWMLEGLKRLLEQRHFTQGKTQKETEILFQRASDSITAFKTEMLIFDKNLVVTRSQVFDAYKEYCDLYGLEADNEKRFTQALKETPKISATTVSKPKRERAWKGIGLKHLNDDDTVTDVTDVTLLQYRDNSENQKIKENIERVTSVTGVTTSEKSGLGDKRKACFYVKEVPSGEKCDCGKLAVTKEVLTPQFDVLRRCENCFQTLRGKFPNAEWKAAYPDVPSFDDREAS